MNPYKRKTVYFLIFFVVATLFCIGIFNKLGVKAQEYYECDDSNSLAPFVPTPMEVVEEMLKLAEVTKKDVVYDIGCGDGRIVVMAAEKYGAKGVGIDYDIERVTEAKELVKKKKVEKLVKIIHQDAMTVDLSDASVVTLYLLESSNIKLRPNLEKFLKPGARVVSHDFDMKGWNAKKIKTVIDEEGDEHTLFLWIIGQHKPKNK